MDARRLRHWVSTRAHASALAQRLAEQRPPPLIVIGMHRSGTSWVTRLLRACGGHFGTELDRNSDLWKQLDTSGGMAIHVAGEFPELTLELWAIRG